MEARAMEAEGRILLSSTKDDALANAISATELYMKAIKFAKSEQESKRLKKKCMLLLARAEEIKRTIVWSPLGKADPQPFTLNRQLGDPQPRGALSNREELILLEGSRLHGSIFPPWDGEPNENEFHLYGQDLYIDNSIISITSTRNGGFVAWKRPLDLFRTAQYKHGPDHAVEPTMLASKEIDLVQDVTADCSVVASLCAAISRSGHAYEKFLEAIFYPYDRQKNVPVMSENGRYIFRLHFNGCFRKVVIDDHLPASSDSRTLHVVDRQNPGLLWPALVEKAYLKVRGGYDFPGSNSGTDLWVLTSWIPEQIFLQSDDLQLQELWQRALESFDLGDVMVTLGTGRMSATEEETLGLAGEHDYAVLQMKETRTQRILLVKNPWCDGMIWRGQQPLVSTRTDQLVSREDELQEVPPKSSELSLGTFWITFEEVIRNFNSLYLNWNPNIFRYRQDHHFSWSIPQAISPGLFTHNPQYSVKSTVGGLVWILLSRHFSTEEHIITTQEKIVQRAPSEASFISLYVFDGNGERIHLSDNAILRSPFVDSPQTLVKLDIPAETSYTLVVAQEGLTLPKYSFTLSAYSRALVTVDKATNPYSFCKIMNAAWTVRTAGGNSSAPTYPSNPQFKLSIATRSNLVILVEANPLDLAVHVKVVLAGGQRVIAVNAQAILGESGDYRRGFALAKISDISPGNYTIVCSTFEPGQIGKFSLRVESTAHCEVVAIANEDAGRLSHPLPRLTFQAGINRILAPIFINRLSRLRIVARLARTGFRVGAGPLLKVSLEKGQGPHKVVLGISDKGAFSDAPAGVRMGDVDLSPDMCDHGGIWLVVKRFGNIETVDEVEVEILSDNSVTIGQWGTGTG